MSEFAIRAAKADELAAIGALTVRAYQADGYLDEDQDTGYAAKLADAEHRAKHAEVLAAVDGSGELLGSLTIALPGTEYAELSRDGELEFRMLAVAPAARGRGVGEALTRAVLDRARELGATKVVLCSLDRMKPAHRLYERIGFVRDHKRDWAPVPSVPLIAYRLDVSRNRA